MKAVVWTASSSLSLEDRAEPEPGPGEVLVRVEGCGICGSDLHFLRGEFPPPVGLSPGHEIAGVVEGGDGIAAGTAVAIDPMLSCLKCADCRNAQSSVCTNSKLMGISTHGGFQQRFAVPAENCYALPEGLDPALGSLAEPVAVAVRGIQRAEIEMGARVLILGAGTVGLTTAMLLRDRVPEVAITARYPHQREAALKLGASAVFESGSNDLKAWGRDRRPDVVIETVGGTAETLVEAFKAVRGGGTVLTLGVFTGMTQVNGFRLVNEEIRVIGSVMYGRTASNSEFGVAVRELARYRADLPVLQTHTYPLGRAQEAFDAAVDKSQLTLKVTVLPNG